MSIGDTAVMVIVIIIAAGVMFVVPMVLVADKVDDSTILQIQDAVNVLGEAITVKSEVTRADLDSFAKSTGATGVAIDYDMIVKIPDDNPRKKEASATLTAGDTIYIDLTRTQIENNLKDSSSYKLPSNSPVHIEVKKVSNNWVETLTGKSSSDSVIAYYNGTTK